MENKEDKPRVGMGIMIFKEGKILIGKRQGSFGDGEYSFPGGHIEYMESFDECARRETREECGIEIKNIKFLNAANVTKYSPRHYINIQVTADWESGEPQTFSHEKIGEWQWYYLDNLPNNIFYFSKIAIDAYKSGNNFFDSGGNNA